MGPTLSLRGIDNAVYYRLMPDDPRYHLDFTGTGNSLNILHPRAMALIMDSLRYWVTDMHVDGFRFDLAPVLVRGYEAGQPSAFFEIIQQDPVLSEVKLIAEPWDIGPDGYQLGRFPPGWSEWNGAFRDSVRRFWRGDPGQVPELASRLTGSSDIYAPSGRRTYASVNFVTCHDGFTLTDLVSYEQRHNEANGGDSNDGAQENNSRNWGVEGPSESVTVARMRDRMKRNFLTTLMFSQGVRMLLGGDENGRTQLGNNNAYCQDNEIGWVNWDIDEGGEALCDFTAELISIVGSNPILRRRDFFSGKPESGNEKDVTWIRSDGHEMTEEDWSDPENRTIGMLLDGQAADEIDFRGRRSPRADTILLLLNASTRSRSNTLPHLDRPGRWEELLNTARPGAGRRLVRSTAVNLVAHSSLLLRHDERLGG
jgi:glycogen operon protein